MGEQFEAHQRAEAEPDRRDPKVATWGLLLLYPVAAFAIWIGLFQPPPANFPLPYYAPINTERTQVIVSHRKL